MSTTLEEQAVSLVREGGGAGGRLGLGLWAARTVRALCRASGIGGGTTVPGKVLLRAEPAAIERLSAQVTGGSVLVSATNGKTTTARMLAGVLEAQGRGVVHNRAGSNLSHGVAAALMDARGVEDPVGVFEVDEAWVPPVARSVAPRVIVLMNLFRDQLDRHGEMEAIAERWASLVSGRQAGAFVLNADDPLVAHLGCGSDEVTYFGVDDRATDRPDGEHAKDSTRCRHCDRPLVYRARYLSHLGEYGCLGCSWRRPSPAVAAERVVLKGLRGSRVTMRTPLGTLALSLSLPGLHNVYNALAATAAAIRMGADLTAIQEGLEGVSPAFGRGETVQIDDRVASITLVKNPVAVNEVLRTLTAEGRPLDLWLALNDDVADGRDVSWIWDADFEVLAGRTASVTCSGTRAEDLAMRLRYAGVQGRITVDRSLSRSFDTALHTARGPLYALPTYTALLALRELLTRQGVAGRWAA